MSLLSAFNTVKQSFDDIKDNLGVSEVKVGIPDDPFNHPPGLYIDPPTEDRNRSGLKRSITTSTIAVITVLYVFPKSNLAVGDRTQDELVQWMLDRAADITAKIDSDNDTGVYLADGDRGFAAYVIQNACYYRPDDPVSGIRTLVRVEAYH